MESVNNMQSTVLPYTMHGAVVVPGPVVPTLLLAVAPSATAIRRSAARDTLINQPNEYVYNTQAVLGNSR